MPGLRAALGTALIAAVAALVLAACGSSGSTSSTSASAATTTPSSATAVTTSTASSSGSYAGHTTARKLRGVSGARVTVALLKRFPRVSRSTVSAHVKGLEGLSLVAKLNAVANVTANVWAELFQRAGGALPPAGLDLIAGQPANCGANQITASSSPEYCLSTDTIELPLGFMNANIAPLGDSALVLMVADLYGYHVEKALGLFSRGLDRSRLELTDSCFSGVLFAELFGALDANDEAGVNRLLAASAPVSAAGGGPTAAQLADSFNTGIVYHDFHRCVPAGA